MLKSCLLAGVASVVVIAAASAADLPSRVAPPVYVAPMIPTFTWTGFYAGGNAGYAWTSSRAVHTTADDAITASQLGSGTVPGTFPLRGSGVTGGGQVGYNYQFPAASFGSIVLGVEADAAYTGLDKSGTYFGTAGVPNTYSAKLDYLGTVRGRLGVAFDRVLVYGTGGFAYGHASLAQGIYPVGLPAGFPYGAIWAGHGGDTQTGYAFGGGIEYALPIVTFVNQFGAGVITLRAEYLHYDLGSLNVPITPAVYGPAGTSFNDRIRTTGNIVRGGINYKFNFAPPAVPVVARY